MATRQAVLTFRDVFASPDTLSGENQTRTQIYDILLDYYTNRAFEESSKYDAYLSKYRLYRRTRLIYNPVRRLVDFYAGQVYPGTVFEDPANDNDFQQAVPIIGIPDDSPLRLAIQQLWTWTNFQSLKARYVRVGAMTGNVGVMIIDDPNTTNRILFEVVWPGFVRDFTLDKSGNLKFFSLEYRAVDEDGIVFTYRKDITPDKIETFRDDAPEGFDGQAASYTNPYGFVPAIWAKHSDTGTDYGAPAIGGTISKIDELNSVIAHIHDQIHKLIACPQIISTDGDISAALKPKDASEAGIERQEATLLLKTVGQATVHQLVGNLELDKAMLYCEKLLAEIEHDHPELTFWQQLREMTQVTGPGASRLLGDVQARVWEAASNYDQQLIKLIQMGVAIAGFRVNSFDWEENAQTRLFEPFSLESYRNGELDFGIAPRPIVPVSQGERITQDKTQAEYAASLKDFLAIVDVLVLAGFDQKEAEEMAKRKMEEAEANSERQIKQQQAIAAANGNKPGQPGEPPTPSK